MYFRGLSFYRLLGSLVVGWLISGGGLWAEGLAESQTETHARRVQNLYAYIAGDYSNAVDQGRVLDPNEYKEMLDFSRIATRDLQCLEAELGPKLSPVLGLQSVKLEQLIEKKAPAAEVEALSEHLRLALERGLRLATAPERSPDWNLARGLYQEHCASCHGVQGRGNGPLAGGLDPVPADFHAKAFKLKGSPAKSFNTISLGIDGTAMAPYHELLPSDSLWSLAFYLSAASYPEAFLPGWDQQNPGVAPGEAYLKAWADAGLSLALLGSKNDLELLAWIESVKLPEQLPALSSESQLRWLRLVWPFVSTEEQHALWQATTSELRDPRLKAVEGIKLTRVYMAKAIEALRLSDERAYDAALLDAYLLGFEATERYLRIDALSLVHETEAAFLEARHGPSFAKGATALAQRQADLNKLEALIDRAALSLESGTHQATGGLRDFWLSLVIILREGLEAFLVVGILLSMLSRLGQAQHKKWIHAGWISAIGAGGLSFALISRVVHLSGAHRELVEAVCTGLAALMLFHVSFWVLSQKDRKEWQGFISGSALRAIDQGKLWGLFGLAFVAVFREAMETALFYQALLAGKASGPMVLSGLSVGVLILCGLCTAMVRFGAKLPLAKLFSVSSSFMVLLALILLGKTVHELIEGAYIAAHAIRGFPSIELIGLYPYWETLGIQLLGLSLALVFLRGSMKLNPQSAAAPRGLDGDSRRTIC